MSKVSTPDQTVALVSGSTTPAPVATSTSPRVGDKVEAYFMPGLVERLQFLDYLDLSYEGGVAYKYGRDARGRPILVPHEQEIASMDPSVTQGPILGTLSNATQAQSPDEIKSAKYQRRLQIAAYENNVKPIVDKFVAYSLRNPPKRSDDETAIEEFKRIDLDEHIREMVHTGLKMTESLIGFDAARLPFAPGDRPSEAQVALFDPVHKGKPYVVRVDPRCVVDLDVDEKNGCDILRIVIEEREIAKASLAAEPKMTVRYKEWTATTWTIYERVAQDGTPAILAPDAKFKSTDYKDARLVVVDTGTHDFGRCPWFRFKPKFPTVDFAELSRLLFNVGSLLNEELFGNTFSQWWATGVTPAEIANATRGVGNVVALPDSETKVGVFGAIPEQARSLMDRCAELRDSLYVLVSMENTATKNVAESAAKKKRDLESLYTTLVGIVEEIEKVENRLLVAMKIIDTTENEDALTRYDRNFDVESVAELIAEIDTISKLSFVPPDFKRSRVSALIRKLDPFGDHEELEDEIEELIDLTPSLVDAITSLDTAGYMTPELVVELLGVPEEAATAMLAGKALHKNPLEAAPMPGATPPPGADPEDPQATGTPEPGDNGSPVDPEDTEEEDPQGNAPPTPGSED